MIVTFGNAAISIAAGAGVDKSALAESTLKQNTRLSGNNRRSIQWNGICSGFSQKTESRS